MKILMTGSSGYLGQRVVELLAADPEVERIIGIDVAPPRLRPDKLQHVQHDVTRPFEEHARGVDAAIHLAFIVNPMKDERLQERINLGGTANFIAAVRAHKVPTAIGLTSATTYGAHPDNPPLLTEADPLRGNDDYAYARDKVRQEALFNSLREPGISLKILRPVVIIGPNVDNFISRYLSGRLVVTPSGFQPRGQFVHERDVARAVITLLRKGAAGPYNIAGDGFLDVQSMARKLNKRITSVPLPVMRMILDVGWRLGLKSITEAPPGMASFVAYPWCVDNSRLKTETGFRYEYTGEQAFDTFVASLKK